VVKAKTKTSKKSIGIRYKLDEKVIVLKNSKERLILLDSENQKFFFQISGELAVKSYELLCKGQSHQSIMDKLGRLKTGLTEAVLNRELKKLTADLVKSHLIQKVK